MPALRNVRMTEEKKLRAKIVIAGFVFIGLTIALMKLLGDSYLVTIYFVVGWLIFLAYMLKLRSLGKR